MDYWLIMAHIKSKCTRNLRSHIINSQICLLYCMFLMKLFIGYQPIIWTYIKPIIMAQIMRTWARNLRSHYPSSQICPFQLCILDWNCSQVHSNEFGGLLTRCGPGQAEMHKQFEISYFQFSGELVPIKHWKLNTPCKPSIKAPGWGIGLNGPI